MGKEAAKQTTGIVMIDEVDMFLHPKWQQTILPSLQEAFPKIQFIVTTHSPQVLSTVKRENIRVINVNAEGKTVAEMPEFHPLGHESGDSLSHIMGTSTRPLLAFDEQIVKYEQLVRSGQEDSVDAQIIKKELDDVGYIFKDSDLKTWQFLASRKRMSL
jgi:predicted ATP-binding protein involved in virulence